MKLPTSIRHQLLRLAPRVLFHGTRFTSHILRDNELGVALGDDEVSFTRCPDVAFQHALRPKYDFDDGRGAIFALDRDRLARDRRPEPSARNGWHRGRDGAAECVVGPVADLSMYVVGILRLEDIRPGRGLAAPRMPRGRPYVPVEPTTRQWLVERLQALNVSHVPLDGLQALEAFNLEIQTGCIGDWPFLNPARQAA